MRPAIGVIAGNGKFPLYFARGAKAHQRRVVAVCHLHETDPTIEALVDTVAWVRVGELGKIIAVFQKAEVKEVVMAGGINRVKWFGGVKLDLRGAALLAKLRSTKDDVIMRGIAAELESEGIKVLPCTMYVEECTVKEGVLTKAKPSKEEYRDIEVGIAAIQAMSSQDIGQVVVVRQGVIVAVEAVEGTDATILRGGLLGGKGGVVVKFSKTTQDMRFDVPTVGIKTVESIIAAKAKVLALEAGRCLIMEQEEVVRLANRHEVVIVGVAEVTVQS